MKILSWIVTFWACSVLSVGLLLILGSQLYAAYVLLKGGL